MPTPSKNATIDFGLTYETAIALQSILTQQYSHIMNGEMAPLISEFDQITPFFNMLTAFVEKHS